MDTLHSIHLRIKLFLSNLTPAKFLDQTFFLCQVIPLVDDLCLPATFLVWITSLACFRRSFSFCSFSALRRSALMSLAFFPPADSSSCSRFCHACSRALSLYGIARISTSGPAGTKCGNFPFFCRICRNSGIFGSRSKQNEVANKPRSSEANL